MVEQQNMYVGGPASKKLYLQKIIMIMFKKKIFQNCSQPSLKNGHENQVILTWLKIKHFL